MAPNFQAVDQTGHSHSLKQYHGRWVLVYFYPKDNTPGCTTEACSFRDAYSDLKEKLVLLGVSSDSQVSHQNFAQKFKLPFPLLADTDQIIINAYGANGLIMPKRVSFLIDPSGKIFKIYQKVNVNEHAQQILDDLATQL